MEGLPELLLFLVCIIELIIQIILIIKLKRTKDCKYWNIFIGISIASFISTTLAYKSLSNNTTYLGEAIACMMACGFSFISNLIISIIGLIIKKVIKINNNKINKSSFFAGALVLILNIFIILILPLIVTNITLKVGEKQVIKYLNNKYGNSNYKMVSVYKEYYSSGMFDISLSGYHYEMKSDYMNNTFIVSIDYDFNYINEDYFLPVYYSQKNNLKYNLIYDDNHNRLDYDFTEFINYIEEIINKEYSTKIDKNAIEGIYKNYVYSWNNIDGVTYNSNYHIVSVNNRKIPTIKELTNSLIKYSK